MKITKKILVPLVALLPVAYAGEFSVIEEEIHNMSSSGLGAGTYGKGILDDSKPMSFRASYKLRDEDKGKRKIKEEKTTWTINGGAGKDVDGMVFNKDKEGSEMPPAWCPPGQGGRNTVSVICQIKLKCDKGDNGTGGTQTEYYVSSSKDLNPPECWPPKA